MITTDCIVLTLCIALLIYAVVGRRRIKLPPGPRGLPILGNIFQVTTSNIHLKHAELASKYGPIIHFRHFTEDVILLTTQDAASALVDKRSSNYADRPRQVMAGELIGWDRALAIAPAGPRHRAHRKLINNILSITAVKRLWPIQESAAHRFIEELFETYASKPGADDRFLHIMRWSVSKSVAGIVFGESASSDHSPGMSTKEMDQYIHDAEEAQATFGKTTVPYSYLVDSLPWLRHVPDFVPFTGFKREARAARQQLAAVALNPYLKTRDRIAAGVSQASYVDACLASNPHPSPEEEDSIAWTGVSAYTGGTDTTIASLTTILLLTALNSTEQELVHKEIDNIIGADRMPCLDDKPALPYTTAFIEECRRLTPVLPFGVPHKAIEEDVYEGYAIPKGSTVMTSLWCMMHDSKVYANPHTFEPDRFLPAEGIDTIPGVSVYGRDEPGIGNILFGFGRRICPGMHLANSGVWIYMACFLWAYQISLPSDEKGKTLDNFEFIDGQIRLPKPFKAEVRVRSKNVEEYLRKRMY